MSSSRMSIQEAAQHLGVSRRTITGYIGRGLLSVAARTPDGKKWLYPDQVEELRQDKAAGTARSHDTVRRERLETRAAIRRLQAQVELLLQIVDAKEEPLGLDGEAAKTLLDAASAELKATSWTTEELGQWTEIFLRLTEEDLQRVAAASGDTRPYVPFLRLCVAMITNVYGRAAYKTDLDLQLMHKKLTEARRRLRVSAFCFIELYGTTDPEIERASLLDSTRSLKETLLSRVKTR